MKISTEYLGDMRFGHGEGTSRVIMDAKPEVGGKGEALTPKQMVLQGLAGCTGMDVAAILRKKKVEYESFTIDVEAEQTSSHPMVFKAVSITYRFKADPEDRASIERAIELSKNSFCGVSAMLAKTAKITTELQITPLEQGSGG